MKKILLIILFCLYIVNFIFSESLSNYSFTIIKKINIGKQEGLIGFKPSTGGGYPGPATWTISTAEKIYIPDRINKRLNVYNLDLNYSMTIIEIGKKECQYALDLKIDDNNNIIALLIGKGLKKINQQGEKQLFVNWKEIPNRNQYNYFPIDNKIFYYNDDNEIIMISEDGQIVQNTQAIKTLAIINNNILLKNRSELNLSQNSDNLLKNIMNTSKYIMLGTNMYNSSFRAVKKYFEEIEDVRQEIILKRGNTKSVAAKKNIDFDLDNYGLKHIGYDNKNNSYWHAMELMHPDGIENHAIVVFSKYGELLDAFFFSQHRRDIGYNYDLYETTNSIPAVAPNGDVYFIRGPIVDFSEATMENPDPKIIGDKVYTFWKIKCNW